MLSDEAEEMAIVEGPEFEDAGGGLEEFGIGAAAGEGVEDFPGGAEEEDEAGVGEEGLPEVEEVCGAGIFPAPEGVGMCGGFLGDELSGFFGEVGRDGNGILGGPADGIEPVVLKDFHVEIEEVAVFEMAFDVADVGGDEAFADGDSGGLEERSGEGSSGTMHAGEDEGGGLLGVGHEAAASC